MSAHQLVYGTNSNLPSNLTNDPPALCGSTECRTVELHINTLHAMRQEFTKAESSERIRRALRKQTRSELGPFVQGDKVYYKRPDSTKWKGPATIIGQEGAVVFARHGGTMVRVHKSRLQKKGDVSDMDDHKEVITDKCTENIVEEGILDDTEVDSVDRDCNVSTTDSEVR